MNAADVFASESAWLIDDAGRRQLEAAAASLPTASAATAPVAAAGPITVGRTAVVPVVGPLLAHPNIITMILGWSSIRGVHDAVLAADADPDVQRIVLSIDSPGGVIVGLPELADAIQSASTETLAHSSGMIASAAMWIASAADAVYTGRVGMLGSIGVRAQHLAPEPGTVVSRNAPRKVGTAADVQAIVDAVERQFIADVARGRGVSEAFVVENFGRGALLVGPAAVAAGLADGIASLEDVIAGRTSAAPSTGAAAVAATSDDAIMREACALAADRTDRLFAPRRSTSAPTPAAQDAAPATPLPIDASSDVAAALAIVSAERAAGGR